MVSYELKQPVDMAWAAFVESLRQPLTPSSGWLRRSQPALPVSGIAQDVQLSLLHTTVSVPRVLTSSACKLIASLRLPLSGLLYKVSVPEPLFPGAELQ